MGMIVINIDHELFRVHRVKQACRGLDSTATNNAALRHVWNFFFYLRTCITMDPNRFSETKQGL